MKKQLEIKPKIDYYLLVIPLLMFLPAIVLIIAFSESFITSGFVLIGIFLFGFLIFRILVNIKYYIDLTRQELVIKSIFSLRSIPINKITLLKKTSSIKAAPAPSLDRIEIFYNHVNQRSLIISPLDKEKFYRALLEFNNEITFS